MKHNTRLNIILQSVGLVWMALAGWLIIACVMWLRPDFNGSMKTGMSINLLSALLLLVVMVISIVLHELVHGFFFWLFARHRPEFGIGPGYAFAAMPDWFYPKNQYLVIALAPLLVLTVLGLSACIYAPLPWLGLMLAGMIINAGGAIGDMYVAFLIARESKQVWIRDTGDGFELFRLQGG